MNPIRRLTQDQKNAYRTHLTELSDAQIDKEWGRIAAEVVAAEDALNQLIYEVNETVPDLNLSDPKEVVDYLLSNHAANDPKAAAIAGGRMLLGNLKAKQMILQAEIRTRNQRKALREATQHVMANKEVLLAAVAVIEEHQEKAKYQGWGRYAQLSGSVVFSINEAIKQSEKLAKGIPTT